MRTGSLLRALRARALASTLGLLAAPASAFEGVVLLPDGRPAADAVVSVLGQVGSARTGHDGRFRWVPDPPVPFDALVVLPGEVHAVVRVESLGAGPVRIVLAAAFAESVTVSAGATPFTEGSPAAAAHQVGREDLEERRPANLTEALEAVPGVGRLEEGQSAVPTIRGLARGRTLILIDGARVTAERRAGPSATYLDPFFLEGVEVSRGLGSVAYGSDAFGGIIHARTRQARPRRPLEARVQAAAGTGIPERSVGAEATRGFEDGGVIVQGRYRDFEDYRSPRGAVGNSSFRDVGARARLDHEWGPGRLHLGWQSDLGRDVGKPATDSNVVRAYYPREDSHRFTLGYEPDPFAGFTRAAVQAFLGRYRLVTDRDRLPAPSRTREVSRADVAAWDYGLRLAATRPVGAWRLQGGVDVNGRAGLRAEGAIESYDAAGALSRVVHEVSVEEAARSDFGVYLALDGAPLPRLTASGGARLDRVATRNRGGFFGERRSSDVAASGFLALTAGPVLGATATGQVGWGFRDPTLSDRYFRGVSGRGFVTGSPDLSPERSLQYDLALRRGGRVRVAVYLYRYRIRDLVERYRAGADFFFRNRGRATLRGAELEAQAELGRGVSFELGAQAAAGEAEDGSPLADVPHEGASLTLRRAFGPRGSVMVRAFLRARDGDAGPVEVPTPSSVSLDAAGTWRVGQLEIGLALKNAFDRAYPQTADEAAALAPGRSALLRVLASF